MKRIDFSTVASEYEDRSPIQKSAADELLDLLAIMNDEDVLDLGCGVGNPTRKIRRLTGGKVVGIDPAKGMIQEAIKKAKSMDITFEMKSAEDMDYENCFDVIFCNSAFQWFSDPEKAVENCQKALRTRGRIGIQAPAKRVYCPNFVEAIEKVKEDPMTRDIFAHFYPPWFLLETAEEYKDLFERLGLKVILARMEAVKTRHMPEEVFNIFSSAAAAGYLNQDYYDIEISEDFIDSFKTVIRNTFIHQADDRGMVTLVFNRIFLIAVKI